MKHYMLFIREDLELLKQLTEEQNQEYIQSMLTWVEELSKTGNFVSGDPLEPEARLAKKEEILHDGAFIEVKEGISGYMIIMAENIEQASKLAQDCPLMGGVVRSIEVRPIMKF